MKNIRYTESHEWISLQGKVGTVGITHYAQKELGEIVYIELPKVGQTVKTGQEACVLESTKAAADVYSPVSGKILEVNEAVHQSPGFLNKTAETTGWLFRIELFDLREFEQLLLSEQYARLIF